MNTYFYKQTDSTNLQAKKLAENGEVHGTVVWAQEQTAGRGRLGKKWVSAAGQGLNASFILRPDVDFTEYAKITLVAGVAVARFLKKELQDQRCPCELALKWPNDVFIGGKKIAGILAEAAPPGNSGYAPYVIVGVGVNILQESSDFPSDIRPNATSLFIESGDKSPSFLCLLENLTQNLLRCVACFEQGGFSQLLTEWRTMDYLYGKKMECVNMQGDVVAGVSLGPDDSGILHLIGEDGRSHEILSGDLRLANPSAIKNR